MNIAGALELIDNNPMTFLQGLESVTHLRGDLIISSNDGMTLLEGLEGVARILAAT